ncbi:hypothetical protein DL766_010596 [Monosporascus sp. MC13-8B]|uniref:MARVEL domain-containing protein n=1 Tax=Monosporascus cannonballus TaxID=155416 RepID=A0ABY0H0H4_9PEZI|nr:hypothetical protein DL762_008083 [Monosporascus cannonballus]RYO84702.1 hypothetical protein DL763_007387 [Monosporascus cannonballus]RYP01955.1 hypothetical protein DL766_010596 [Monosporascus sp. MC13-8B]
MSNGGITTSTTIEDEEKGLHRTTTGVTMSPELFEKVSPSAKAREVLADPASSTSPRKCLGGIFFFTGPLLLLFAMIFEWVMGNFFPMMVMGLFTVFWLSFGVLQLPTLGLGIPYMTESDPTGTMSPEYNAAVALYLVCWGFALLTFFFFTLRINLVFAMIFCLTTTATWALAGAYWKLVSADYEAAQKLQKTGGAILFVVASLGWYMCFIIMAGEMRIPINLPVGDLSHFWPRTDVELGASEKRD